VSGLDLFVQPESPHVEQERGAVHISDAKCDERGDVAAGMDDLHRSRPHNPAAADDAS